MTEEQEPKPDLLARLKERMKNQLYVPSISTLALTVASAGLIVAILNGVAQRERWKIEDDTSDPHPQVSWSHELVQSKYRTLGFSTPNSLTNPIRLISIEFLQPAGATLAAYSDYGNRQMTGSPSNVAVLNRMVLGNAVDSLYLALQLPDTPNDQGQYVEFRVNYEETTSIPRRFTKYVRHYVPDGADKR
jgi:hypothetical protein